MVAMVVLMIAALAPTATYAWLDYSGTSALCSYYQIKKLLPTEALVALLQTSFLIFSYSMRIIQLFPRPAEFSKKWFRTVPEQWLEKKLSQQSSSWLSRHIHFRKIKATIFLLVLVAFKAISDTFWSELFEVRCFMQASIVQRFCVSRLTDG